jgi:hypothetical protein
MGPLLGFWWKMHHSAFPLDCKLLRQMLVQLRDYQLSKALQ